MDTNDAPLLKIRAWMQKIQLAVCIIPTSDPHSSEYLTAHWQFRAYLSGFSGSSGTLVVSQKKAGLWTDSRYFLQAKIELLGTEIELFKTGLPETPTPEQWIFEQGYPNVGIDGTLISAEEGQRLEHFFSERNIPFTTNIDPYEASWPDRPSLPKSPIQLFDQSYSGESTLNKLNRVRKLLQNRKADYLILSALDEIGWLFNIRGADIEYNPVVMAFSCITADSCTLFIDQSRITPDLNTYFSKHNISTAPYESFIDFLSQLNKGTIWLDQSKTNYEFYRILSQRCHILNERTPVNDMKALKNPTELKGFKEAMYKDGIAWIRLMRWIEEQITLTVSNDQVALTEWQIGRQAIRFRSEQAQYIFESFAPIVAFNDHGAIVHYEAEKNTAYPIAGSGVLLMDMGGHFLNGTTDTTRTLYINGIPPTAYQTDYTNLLKGLIALSTAIFPEGTRGTQLDVLARQYIWKENLNYLHGTGHGIGHCLYVHEGPQSIRMNENPVILKPGMITSNEPAIYRTGKYGIRLENVIHVIEKGSSEFGRFFGFETLTLVPFDGHSIQIERLSKLEKDWLNQYHNTVYATLSVGLTSEEQRWLEQKTHPIS